MSDILTDTKRFTNTAGFKGASTNDLIRIAAQAIDYAGEISLKHSQTTKDIPVAYCVFGKHFRQVTTNNDHEKTMANVINAIRLDNDCVCSQGATSFEFQYDGMTFTVYVEDLYDQIVAESKDSMVEEAQYEFDRMSKDTSYLSNYIKFDDEMFRRDLEHDEEAMVSPYDGVVHEMFWNEYNSDTTTDRQFVTRRQTLYMIRED
tara:strand:+ start:17713 stop:18324 length:612 start_codon:yes stop_codon:yes gene_type:complete